MSTRPRTPGHGAPGPGKLPITELLGMKASHSADRRWSPPTTPRRAAWPTPPART